MRTLLPAPRRLVVLSALVLVAACAVGGESGYQRYADRVAVAGDSAVLAVATYRGFDSTATLAWDGQAAATLERLATAFAAIPQPDTAVASHRLMLDGLDTLVVAMRTLERRNTQCRETPTVACADARDFGRLLGSIRRGDSLYRDGRLRLEAILGAAGATLPELPAPTARR